ncbi:4-hydroxybenzoate octaprenyltransferase [Limibacillus halophilus]|jgi:4-hydroxybenzoate polyprenyltransferase
MTPTQPISPNPAEGEPQYLGVQRADASDLRRDHWSLRMAPEAWRPYLQLIRFDRSIGSWLLLWPGWWAIALASVAEGHAPSVTLLALFGVGAVLMRGAGCVINDLWDRDIDSKVARTATRPLASGRVRVRQALAFLAGLLGVSFLILLQLTPTAIWLGVASLLLVVTYPFMKRVTYWPQAFLGLTFNWGALMGWVAVTDGLAWPALLLYVGGIAWTLGYDTIYAYQDREDDALIGIKSSALKLGERPQPWLYGFFALALALFGAAALTAGVGGLFWLGWLAALAQAFWQVSTLDINAPRNCLVRFISNKYLGFLLWLGILGAAL